MEGVGAWTSGVGGTGRSSRFVETEDDGRAKYDSERRIVGDSGSSEGVLGAVRYGPTRYSVSGRSPRSSVDEGERLLNDVSRTAKEPRLSVATLSAKLGSSGRSTTVSGSDTPTSDGALEVGAVDVPPVGAWLM